MSTLTVPISVSDASSHARSFEGEAMDGEDEDEVEHVVILPDPVRTEDALRCTRCAWEVIDCICCNCGLEHSERYEDEPSRAHSEFAITSTEFDMLHPDRQVVPRGSTPTDEVDPSAVLNKPDYCKDNEMFQNLLARGASRAMCERYRLEFYHQFGIIAWADEALVEEFAGSEFEQNDRWQICLGRRIELAADDEDGSAFMTDLVEAATIFQLTPAHEQGRWDNFWVHHGRRGNRPVWVTAPLSTGYDPSFNDNGDDDSDLSEDGLDIDPYNPPTTLFVDEYEDDSEPEDEGMDVDPSYSPERDFYSDGQPYERDLPAATLPDSAWDSENEFRGEGDMDVIDSDEPGSDWDSDEIMSGDEVAVPGLTELGHRSEEGNSTGDEDDEGEDEDDGEVMVGVRSIENQTRETGDEAGRLPGEEGGVAGEATYRDENGGTTPAVLEGKENVQASSSGGVDAIVPLVDDDAATTSSNGEKDEEIDELRSATDGDEDGRATTGDPSEIPRDDADDDESRYDEDDDEVGVGEGDGEENGPDVAIRSHSPSEHVAINTPPASQSQAARTTQAAPPIASGSSFSTAEHPPSESALEKFELDHGYRPILDWGYWDNIKVSDLKYRRWSPTIATLEGQLKWHKCFGEHHFDFLIRAGTKEEKFLRVKKCVRSFWRIRATYIEKGQLEEKCSGGDYHRWPKWILELEQPSSL